MSTIPPSPIRIMCVDDNELLAEALARRLGAEADFHWVGIVTDGTSAYNRIIETKPHLVLLDIDMPDLDSFSVVERLAESSPEIRVLMFSGHVSHEYIRRAIDGGAWGYLSKNDDIDRLINSLRLAGRGEFVFSSEVEAVMRTH